MYTRRLYKKNNKSRRIRKNKTTRRYKRQMKGGGREEYLQKQQEIKGRINEIFLEKQLLVAEYKGDKIIIKKGANGDILSFNYDEFVESGGKDKVVTYDFTKETFLKNIDNGRLTILDEDIVF